MMINDVMKYENYIYVQLSIENYATFLQLNTIQQFQCKEEYLMSHGNSHKSNKL